MAFPNVDIRVNADYKANRVDYSQTPEEETPFSQMPDVYAGSIFTTNYPTGSWIKFVLIKLMRHCFWSCISVKYNCSYKNKLHEVL